MLLVWRGEHVRRRRYIFEWPLFISQGLILMLINWRLLVMMRRCLLIVKLRKWWDWVRVIVVGDFSLEPIDWCLDP